MKAVLVQAACWTNPFMCDVLFWQLSMLKLVGWDLELVELPPKS